MNTDQFRILSILLLGIGFAILGTDGKRGENYRLFFSGMATGMFVMALLGMAKIFN